MRGAERTAALALGALSLIVTAVWTSRYAAGHPLHLYEARFLRDLAPGEAGFALRFAAGSAASTLLLAWGAAPAMGAMLRRIPASAAGRLGPLLPGLAAAGVAAVSIGILGGTVVTDDEHVYLFQARVLAAGRAALDPPPLPEFWGNAFVGVNGGRWFGQYPPGHPLVLLPGVVAGAPYAVPVALAGLTVALVFSLLRRMAGDGWALGGGLLLATSPFFLLTGGTLLSHGTSLFALALFAWGVLDLQGGARRRAGLAAGAGLGLLLATRPYAAITLAAPAAAAAAWLLLRRRRALLPAVLSCTAFVAFLLWYNYEATGDPLRTGYGALRGPGQNEIGFGFVVPGMEPHTPWRGAANVGRLLLRFAVWGFGGPLLLAAAFVPGRNRPEARAAAAVAGASLVAGVLSWVAYWSIGVNDTGPVKTYEWLLPAVVLVTLGLGRLARRTGRGFAASLVTAAIVTSFATFWPGRIAHLREVTARVRLPFAETERVVIPPALVFVENVQARPAGSWVFGRPNPHPSLDDPILYARDLGPRNAELARLHPGRRPYRLQFDGTIPRVTPLFRTAGR